MPDISNYDVYIKRMARSIYDKLFFVDKIFDSVDTFLDFGCADGELIKYVHSFMPEMRFIGYDIDEQMIERAKENVPYAEFYSDWEAIVLEPSKTVVNLSSVLHEIYSYLTQSEIQEFWNRILCSGFKYVVIRDMCFSALTKRQKDALNMLHACVMMSEYEDKLADYEKVWGPIADAKNILHFLLKYRYSENWEREVKENYLPLPVSIYDSIFKRSNYDIMFKRVYTLQYIRNQIFKDFGVDIRDIPTHMQYILKFKE